jgi:hypothetical protein
MIKIKVKKVNKIVCQGISFSALSEELNSYSLFIDDNNNDIDLRYYDFLVDFENKGCVFGIYNKNRKDHISVILILMKKALKVFKKDYPDRYEEVKANIKALSDSILN